MPQKDTRVTVLQIGEQNWFSKGETENFRWSFVHSADTELDAETLLPGFLFDAIIITGQLSFGRYLQLNKFLSAHRIFLVEQQSGPILKMLGSKQYIDASQWPKQRLLALISENFYMKQMGTKMDMRVVKPVLNEQSTAKQFGNSHWEFNLVQDDHDPNMIMWSDLRLVSTYDFDMWMEFEKTSNLQMELEITHISAPTSKILYTERLSEKDLKQGVMIHKTDEWQYLAFKLVLHGSGVLNLGNFHFRKTRHEFGTMLPGGERLIDAQRKELFVYFDSGNLKPPLNIYFAGYRANEGFEGYPMMKNLQHPFILVSDPRLEGGEFYLSDQQELEDQLVDYIKRKLAWLKFKADDLNLLGLSMGTTGALYYATLLPARNVIIGKPLINLEYIATAGRNQRPDDFLTAYDLVEDLKADTLARPLITADDLKNPATNFYIIYMEQDDYDNTAMQLLLDHLGPDVKIVQKGFEGRHNDNTGRVVEWFLIYINEILERW